MTSSRQQAAIFKLLLRSLMANTIREVPYVQPPSSSSPLIPTRFTILLYSCPGHPDTGTRLRSGFPGSFVFRGPVPGICGRVSTTGSSTSQDTRQTSTDAVYEMADIYCLCDTQNYYARACTLYFKMYQAASMDSLKKAEPLSWARRETTKTLFA